MLILTSYVEIIFNSRFYGSLMLSHLFTNWKLKFASWPFQQGGGRQVTFVLEIAQTPEESTRSKPPNLTLECKMQYASGSTG